MFHLADNAVPESELVIMEELGHVARDGLLYYWSEREKFKRDKFNACEVLLHWEVEDAFGVQRIRVGVKQPLSRAAWRRRLLDCGPHARLDTERVSYLDALINSRVEEVRKVFTSEEPIFTVMGWRPTNIAFWNPRTALRIKAAPNARVEQVKTRVARHIFTHVETAAHAKKKAV